MSQQTADKLQHKSIVANSILLKHCVLMNFRHFETSSKDWAQVLGEFHVRAFVALPGWQLTPLNPSAKLQGFRSAAWARFNVFP